MKAAWFDRLLDRRDRLLANPGFQRWAAAFPLTRPVAQARARALFDLCAGFVYSQILLACLKLKLFERLADGPRELAWLAEQSDLSEAAMLRLLRAAISLDLVERRSDGRFGLGGQGAALIGNPGIAAMIEHHTMLYADLADPIALLRGEVEQTKLNRFWSYADAAPGALEPHRVSEYTALMSASQALISGDVLDAYSLKKHRYLLDVGGGDGSFLAAAGRRWPHLRLMLFDLPPVAARAQARFERDGLADRAETFGGDVMRDALPSGADIVSLVRVIHDHDDEPALEIMRAARRALGPGGTLLLTEPMSDTPGAEPIGDAYFGFYLLAMGSGRPRTREELTDMLHAAGFTNVRSVRTRRPLLTRILIASPDTNSAV